MTAIEITKEVKKIINEGARNRIQPDKLTNQTDLIAEMGLDSIEALEILLKVEERFNITIDDEDLNRELFRNLDIITSYIFNKIS